MDYAACSKLSGGVGVLDVAAFKVVPGDLQYGD
jgi:hypothetical protein